MTVITERTGDRGPERDRLVIAGAFFLVLIPGGAAFLAGCRPKGTGTAAKSLKEATAEGYVFNPLAEGQTIEVSRGDHRTQVTLEGIYVPDTIIGSAGYFQISVWDSTHSPNEPLKIKFNGSGLTNHCDMVLVHLFRLIPEEARSKGVDGLYIGMQADDGVWSASLSHSPDWQVAQPVRSQIGN